MSTAEHEVEDSGAVQIIRQAAVIGDRARRTARVRETIARLVLPFAAAACLATLLTVLLRGPRLVGPSLMVAGVCAAFVALTRARRSRGVSDVVAADLDLAADLGGEFRSACWFCATPSASFPPDQGWRQFHLANAARRVAAVDWTAVYARPVDRRRWGAAIVCVLISMLALRWPPTPGRPAPSPHTGTPLAAIAPPSVPVLAEGMRDIASGRVPSKASLVAIGQALDLANADAATKAQLDALFSQAQAATSAPRPDGDSSDENWWGDDERTRDLMSPWALEWAYRDALARASAAQATERQASSRPSSKDDGTQASGDDAAGLTSGKGSTDGAPVLADTRGQTVSFSSLLFGRQMASGGPGDERAAAPGSTPRSPALTAGLRQEVVHASSDVPDIPQSLPGAHRPSSPVTQTAGSSAAMTSATYDRHSGSQPPPIPDARRPLVHDYFHRVAETAGPSR